MPPELAQWLLATLLYFLALAAFLLAGALSDGADASPRQPSTTPGVPAAPGAPSVTA